MKKLTITLLSAALLLAVVFWGIQSVRGQAETGPNGDEILASEVQGENTRQISSPPGQSSIEQPNIGFIDSPSAVCYMPDPNRDSCNINWYYLAVDASPNYMISMTVTLNNFGKVANVAGFFQTSMYVPYNMLGDGFKVACGAPGAGGNAGLGNAYAYTIRARDSANLGSANYGTVYCPPYIP
jgi:hypothetical protein